MLPHLVARHGAAHRARAGARSRQRQFDWRAVPSVTMEEAVEQQAVWTEVPLTGTTPTAVLEATERARAEAQKVKDNRRSHKRVPGKALDWVEVARVKDGPEVSIVDLSKGGVLVESDWPLKPGSKQALEIAAGGKTIVVPFGVLRSKISALGPKGAVYRAACAFSRVLDLPQLANEEACEEASPRATGAEVARVLPPEPLMETVLRESGSETAWASEPAVSTGWQKTVARFADGTVVKGYNIDFDVNRPVFSFEPDAGRGQRSGHDSARRSQGRVLRPRLRRRRQVSGAEDVLRPDAGPARARQVQRRRGGGRHDPGLSG